MTMSKYIGIVIIIITLGFALFSIGIIVNDLIWNIIGGLLIILPPIAMGIKKRERKSLIHYMENQSGPILSTKKTHGDFEENEKWKKLRGVLEKIIMFSIVAAAAMIIVIMMLQGFLSKPSYLTAETVISEGCAILNRGGCDMDPSEITVNYDVNGDEIKGGVNDTLFSLLESYNCTGDCIMRRCACSIY